MDRTSAKALALWFFPQFATWGEAAPAALCFPADGARPAWAAPPDAWRRHGTTGVGGTKSGASASGCDGSAAPQAVVADVVNPPSAGQLPGKAGI